MSIKTENQLVEELESYIENGYLDINSFDNPDDEAATALSELYFINKLLCEKFCKIIINNDDVGDYFLNSLCLSHLFDLNKEYSLSYVSKHVAHMLTPELVATMDGLCQYSNTPFRMVFSDDLVNRIKKRYDELSSDEFSKEMMSRSYPDFAKTFLEQGD